MQYNKGVVVELLRSVVVTGLDVMFLIYFAGDADANGLRDLLATNVRYLPRGKAL